MQESKSKAANQVSTKPLHRKDRMMAKINARGSYQLKAWTTSKTYKSEADGMLDYHERWVLRSDGKVLHRITKVVYPVGTEVGYDYRTGARTNVLDMNSGLSIKYDLTKREGNEAWESVLERMFERKGYAIVRTN